MNDLLFSMPEKSEPGDLVTHLTPLYDKGAEFANLLNWRGGCWYTYYLSTRMTLLAHSAEFVDCKIKFVRLFSLLYAEILEKL